jgi:hypothetical protein
VDDKVSAAEIGDLPGSDYEIDIRVRAFANDHGGQAENRKFVAGPQRMRAAFIEEYQAAVSWVRELMRPAPTNHVAFSGQLQCSSVVLGVLD